MTQINFSGSYDELLARLTSLSKPDRGKLLDNLIDHIQRMGLVNPNIEPHHIQQALKVSFLSIAGELNQH